MNTDFELVADAGSLVVIKKDGPKITVYDNGRLKVDTSSEQIARKAGEKVFEVIEKVMSQ